MGRRKKAFLTGLAAAVFALGSGTNLDCVEFLSGKRGVARVSEYLPMWSIKGDGSYVSTAVIFSDEIHAANIQYQYRQGLSVRAGHGTFIRDNNGYTIQYEKTMRKAF